VSNRNQKNIKKPVIFISSAKKSENPTQMTASLALYTFGGLVLARDGAPVGGAGGQRRPLALLAILAAAGDRGASRDKIIALLWPDSDVEKGKRALAQTVYSLRKATGCDDLITGVADLRLNAGVVDADTFRFAAAIRSENPIQAIETYKGPFCDGFVIPGALDFERWLEAERVRFASECTRVLTRLADAARKEADFDREIEWSRRLVALDPLDSRATLALMDALERNGDTAGALLAARSHESMLRDQLDLPVAPAIAERMERLSRASRTASPAPPVAKKLTRPDHPAPAASATLQRDARSPLLRFGRVGVVLGALAVVAVAAVAFWNREATTAPLVFPEMRPDVIAVLPFEVESRDKSLEFLGQGTAGLMSRWLSLSEKPRAIDPGTILSILESMKPSVTASATARDRAREVARIAGAGEVMIGKISGTPEMLSVSASIFDVRTGSERASTQAFGKLDSLASLVETIAAHLVAQTAVGADRANAFSTAKFAVLRSYLRAESAFHDDNYREAITLYEQALEQDSTFAPAALGLAMASDRRNAAEQHDRGLTLAWAARASLGEHDRIYLEALAGPRYPEPSPIGEQLAAWEKVVTLNPDRATAWVELGERFLYDGGFLGIRNANERAVAAFTKATQLDRSSPRAVRGLLIAAVRSGSHELIDTLLWRHRIAAVGRELTGYLQWRIAIARNDSTTLRVIRSRFPSFSESSLRSIAMSSQNERIAFADGERAARLLSARALLAPEQLDVLLAQHSFAMNQGEFTKALDITEQIEDAQPGSRAHLRLRVLDAIYSRGDSIAAERAVKDLELAADRPPHNAEARAMRTADICVLAQWYAAPWRVKTIDRRRREVVRGWIAEMRTAPPAKATIPVAAPPKGCAEVADAMQAVSRRAADARAKVRNLDNMMLAGPAMGDGTVWATFATARLHDALGDKERALAVIRQRPFMKGWPRYRAESLAEEARLAAEQGSDGAR
jgi:DNA-binding SARP family transcriptional activator